MREPFCAFGTGPSSKRGLWIPRWCCPEGIVEVILASQTLLTGLISDGANHEIPTRGHSSKHQIQRAFLLFGVFYS